MPTRLSILVLDESGVTTRALEDLAAREGLRLQTFRDPPAAVRAAADRSSRPDAIVVDWNGALKEALSLVADFRALLPAVPVILAARDTGAETCLQAMRAGASDVLTRPIDPAEIRAAVIRVRTARPEVERHHGSPADGLDLLLGASRGMERVRDMVARVAPEDVTVLIRGESGTGKDFVAHSIHAASRRASKPFVTVDCGAIARNLIESELFGHEKGSFTGAIARNEGLFHKANAGTLFLDEVGEIPVELQPTLLRAIEEKRFRPVGGTQMVTSDARIISATNRDLEKAVESGGFRLDLYYRLNVVQIVLPPLRSRKEDIPLLIEHFLRRVSPGSRRRHVEGVSREAMSEILAYDWPGNVRELENVIEQAVTLGRHAEIEVEDLPPRVVSGTLGNRPRAAVGPAGSSLLRPIHEIERDAILAALQSTGGDTRSVSQILAIDRSTLYRKMKRYGIDVSQFKR